MDREGFVVHRLRRIEPEEAADYLRAELTPPLPAGRCCSTPQRLAAATGWDGARIAAHAPAAGS